MAPTSDIERYYAHTLENLPPSDWEPLSVHLNKVADSASSFANVFGARSWGEVLGNCHDLGKLSNAFQQYLRSGGAGAEDAGAEEDSPGKRVDHSTFGARYVAEVAGKVQGQLLAFCIAGHHTGLPDETSDEDGGQRATLRHKLDPKKYPTRGRGLKQPPHLNSTCGSWSPPTRGAWIETRTARDGDESV